MIRDLACKVPAVLVPAAATAPIWLAAKVHP